MPGRRLRLAAIATTPLLPLAFLAWINVFNPMTRMFADTIEVVNETDEPIEVTAIGCPGARAVLPLLSTGPVALPVLRAVRGISPRSSTAITYDGDDHLVANLVVEGRRGGPRWVALEDCSTEPREQKTRWVIESVSALPEAPSDMLEAARAASRRGLWLFIAHYGFLIPVGLWFASRRAARRGEVTPG